MAGRPTNRSGTTASAATPDHLIARTVRHWSGAALAGIGVAVAIASRPPFGALPAAGQLLLAILAGWLVFLAVAPWRATMSIARERREIFELAKRADMVARGEADDLEGPMTTRGGPAASMEIALGRVVRFARDGRREARTLRKRIDHEVAGATRRATARLSKEAMTDPLTRLGNRRMLQRNGGALFEPEERSDEPIALIAFDIDRFKPINDTLGHEAGDACLKVLGQILASSLRPDDIAVRIGGDEFVILSPGVSEVQATAVARRLAALFRQTPWPHSVVARPTLSIGVAVLEADQIGSLDALLRRADAALYQSKKSGRDCITCFESRRAA